MVNYSDRLQIEKGDGYDLNMSMFERLVLKGYPHGTLSAQHRMRPEISALVRHLTYPDLVDAPRTQNRPDLIGVRDNIVFINHDRPEDESPQVANSPKFASSSKQNTHEVKMVLKIVRYLGQQGYRTDNLVVLTPYLGQLQNLRLALAIDTDPVLNDLDSHDLLQAGLTSPATAKLNKKPIRLATIGSYSIQLSGSGSQLLILCR
jgi:superfamily I DNA and/or RNA helicase